MPRGRLSSAAALLLALTALVAASAAGGALVIVEGIVLHADGSFQPRALPRHRFAPIDFQGYFDIGASGGGKPVELKQAVIDFDRDGRLSPGGLPVCPPDHVANMGPAEARQACPGAIVGTGRIEALVALPSGLVPASSALTLFNGPPQEGHPTVVLHARTTVPGTQTFAILVPIERRPGPFRYRATIDIPPIAAGLGAITRVEAKVGRRFTVDGQPRSYVSARCSDGILHTHGIFSFASGTIVDGSVEKFCRAR
jgi:hypothetical protein